MTRKLILATVLMLSFTMVSCGTSKTTSDNSSSTPSVSEENSDNNKDTSSVKEDEKEEKDETADSGTNKDNANTDSKNESKTEQIKLPVYSIDDNTTEPNEVSSVSVDKKASLEDKLNALGKQVSKTSFDGLPMKVKSIDTVDGKKVATINLTDSSDKKWSQKFQGSTGGQITTSTLIENFLQTNNKSDEEWIDGVRFLYNDEVIEYEHAYELADIQYRN